MDKRYIIAVFTYVLAAYSCAGQIVNIRCDKDNLYHNSAIFSNIVLKALGKDKVKVLLDNDVRFMVVMDVDNLGNVKKIQLRQRKGKIEKTDVSAIEQYIHEHGIRFPYCVVDDTGVGISKMTELCRDEYQLKGSFSNVFGFPGGAYPRYVREMKEYTYLIIRLKSSWL